MHWHCLFSYKYKPSSFRCLAIYGIWKKINIKPKLKKALLQKKQKFCFPNTTDQRYVCEFLTLTVIELNSLSLIIFIVGKHIGVHTVQIGKPAVWSLVKFYLCHIKRKAYFG